MKVFLDSSSMISLLKDEKKSILKIRKLAPHTTFFTSTINVFELFKGVFLFPEKNDEEGIRKILENVTILDFDWESAKISAQIYTELRKKGKPIEGPDYMIAGCALSNGVNTILSGNKQHFDNISGLKVIEC